MARTKKDLFAHETRRRLIEAAGALFADKGFDATTIQDICDSAGANISAVNYHFGSKMKLYEATLQYTLLQEASAPGRKGHKAEEPEEELYGLVLGMIRNIRLSDKPEWFPRLLRREVMFPTAEFQDFTQRLLKQDFEQVETLLAAILPQAKPAEIKMCTLTLLGQVKAVAMESDLVLQTVFPELKMDARGCERMARHLTDTTLLGMLAVYSPGKKK
jgi:AcrR family transcriptional regulator